MWKFVVFSFTIGFLTQPEREVLRAREGVRETVKERVEGRERQIEGGR